MLKENFVFLKKIQKNEKYDLQTIDKPVIVEREKREGKNVRSNWNWIPARHKRLFDSVCCQATESVVHDAS